MMTSPWLCLAEGFETATDASEYSCPSSVAACLCVKVHASAINMFRLRCNCVFFLGRLLETMSLLRLVLPNLDCLVTPNCHQLAVFCYTYSTHISSVSEHLAAQLVDLLELRLLLLACARSHNLTQSVCRNRLTICDGGLDSVDYACVRKNLKRMSALTHFGITVSNQPMHPG
jgi:hypothetical protein